MYVKLWTLKERKKRSDLIEIYKNDTGHGACQQLCSSHWIYIIVLVDTVGN